MNAIKIHSTKKTRKGAIFHYAPFVLHCLFPEIINQVYRYSTVYRLKTLDSTLGDLSKIYQEVMGNISVELNPDEFSQIDAPIMESEFNRDYLTKHCFDRFTDYIFGRYNIDQTEYNSDYPEVLLVKRSAHVELISDPVLKAQLPQPPENPEERFLDGQQLVGINTAALDYHFLVTNGTDRREIDQIAALEAYLSNKYSSRFGSVFFEHMPFAEQVRHYNNARLIISVHGGCQINQFFSKPGTRIIEIEANGKKFEMFDHISRIQNLDHRKCELNQYDSIIRFIDNNSI